MDISESLKKAENSIRNIYNYILSKEYGKEWYNKCGISENRIESWKENKSVDEKKFGYSDPRLIYYADLYDLKTILRKNWDNGLLEVFDNLKETEILLDILNDIRNPDAHRRELLPYQKHLAIGISGKIRTKITAYFSKMETGDKYYPILESIQDSLGNTWAIGEKNTFNTKSVLRPRSLSD